MYVCMFVIYLPLSFFYNSFVFAHSSQEALKWYGWGYNDSQFYGQQGIICFKGDKYVRSMSP